MILWYRIRSDRISWDEMEWEQWGDDEVNEIDSQMSKDYTPGFLYVFPPPLEIQSFLIIWSTRFLHTSRNILNIELGYTDILVRGYVL